jgi:hypothetical protein
MTRSAIAMLALACIALPGAAGDKTKEERPKLSLRPSPRHGFSPLNVTFTLQLKGGDDIERYYCPEVEWEWGDGGKSVREGDCDPFEPGTKIKRRYTEQHRFKRAGTYRIKVSLSRADRRIAQTSVKVSVKPGLGDRNRPY